MASSKKKRSAKTGQAREKSLAEQLPQRKLAKFNPRTIVKRDPPDAEKLRRVAELVRPDVRLGGTDSSTIEGFTLKQRTPAQEALVACGEWYGTLTEERPELKVAVASMIAFRRMYAVALREVNELVEAAREEYAAKGEEVPVVLADFAVQYAMYLSSKPFNEHDLMDGMVKTVLPWLTELVDKHVTHDQKEELSALAAENEARKGRPVPIGFKHTPTQESTSLTRDRALVLVGWSNAVRWLLDQACEQVLKAKDEQTYTILRFMTNAPKAQDQHARLVRLGKSAWAGCTNSDRDLDTMVTQYVSTVIGGNIDLVVCDDMGEANSTGFVGRLDAARAGDANRRFRRWCDNMGAAFLGAMPYFTPELPDFSGPEWEQLKTFAHVRPVQVLDGAEFDKADHYRLVVGTEASVFDVPKDILNSYGSVLTLPDGIE